MSYAPLSPDSDYDVDALNRQLDRAKTAAFLGSSAAFLGPLMCGMEFVWTEDVETAATDGIHIWWNPKDFLELSFELQKSTLIHELWHPANFHFVRRGDRDPEDWNIAADIDINNQLKKDGYAVEKPYFIWNMDFDGWAVEDIYNKIHQKTPCAPQGSGGQVPGDPKDKGQNNPDGKPGGTCGKDMVPAMSMEDTQRAINNVIQAAYTAQAAREPGAVPGHIQQIITKFLNPILPWDILLDRWFEDKYNEDYTWRRPNRRFQDVFMPSRQSEDRLAHVLFCGDVSGSVSDAEFTRYISEVKAIKDKYNPEKLTFLQFDTQITNVKTFTEDDPFDEIVLVGRGGTSLIPVREYIMEHKPTVVVILSDLLVTPMEPIPFPVLWIAVNNKDAKVKFGKLIHINA